MIKDETLLLIAAKYDVIEICDILGIGEKKDAAPVLKIVTNNDDEKE
jgi:hypothetical protein